SCRVFFLDTLPVAIYTLSLHDALPIFERKVVFLAERAVRRLVLDADAQDDRPDLPESRGVVPECTRFSCTSRGVVFWIEEEHDRLALEVPKADRDAVLVRTLEVGSSSARLQQVTHRPPSNRPSHFKDCPAPSDRQSATDSSGEPRPVLQNLPGGVIARGAGDPSTGMGAGSAEIQAFDWRPVAGPTWHGSEDEGLVQRHLAVIDVSFRQTEPLLQIGGREDLPAEDQSA